MSAVLPSVLVLGVIAIALAVDVAALAVWVRRQWR